MKMIGKVEVYYDNIEGLERGECELVSKTQSIPYGQWKKCTIAEIIIEVEDDKE